MRTDLCTVQHKLYFCVTAMIVNKGGDISIMNKVGNTALHQAAGQGMLHIVNHLLNLYLAQDRGE
jgi:ankyrin repeat protein